MKSVYALMSSAFCSGGGATPMPTAASASLPYSGFVFGRRLRPWGSVKMENPLARTSVTVSPRMPFASSASWMLMKRSTILNMWTLLHWLSEVSSPSSGISRFASGVAETDGPPGAALLGRALRTLGADVQYVTDDVTAPVLAASLGALGEPDDVRCYPRGDGAARAVLDRERPTHLVAIERPGRARDGAYRNMRGVDVSAWNAPIDELFCCSGVREPGLNRRWPVRGARGSGRPINRRPSYHYRAVTIGVGDGGNEIGMGNIRARFAKRRGLAARIGSVVRVDHLVVAGVSNWGAYGIVAHLGRLAGRALLHTPDDERRLVAACVAAGACDGVTRRHEPTVDGLPGDAPAARVGLLAVATRA